MKDLRRGGDTERYGDSKMGIDPKACLRKGVRNKGSWRPEEQADGREHQAEKLSPSRKLRQP